MLWFVQVVCLALHGWSAWAVWDKTRNRSAHYEATVWRILPVWNATAADGHTAQLVDNLQPIRVNAVVGGYFLISALFHLLAVALGPFDRWIWIYWRQVDLAFNWWRWVDLAVTLPMLMMTVCCVINLREQNAIAFVWMHVAGVMGCFFLTELWSRPHRNEDFTYDMSRWTGDDPVVKPGVPWTRLAPEEMQQRALQQSKRRSNYVIRMLPVGLSVFPFVAQWTIILNHYFTSLNDLRLNEADGLYKRTPDFVPQIVVGAFIFSILFYAPIIWFQWCAPSSYWKTEVVYPILSVIFKFYVGYLMYDHVFDTTGTFNAAIALDQSTEAGSGGA